MVALAQFDVMGHQGRLVLSGCEIEHQLGVLLFQSSWVVVNYRHHVEVRKVQERQTQNPQDLLSHHHLDLQCLVVMQHLI